jgi:hypothetical protein
MLASTRTLQTAAERANAGASAAPIVGYLDRGDSPIDAG